MLLHLLHVIRVLTGVRLRRRGVAIGALTIGVVVVRLALWAAANPDVRSWFGIGLPTCEAAQISTPAAREGTCARNQTLFGGGTVYNVVDAGHVLRMPGYDAQLIATSVARTTVTNPQTDPQAYPDGHGYLVSCEISITNEAQTPLSFDAAGRDVDLLIDDPTDLASISFPDLPNSKGEPGPSIADVGTIAPHDTATGWVSFVAAVWTPSVLNQRASDLEFYRAGHQSQSYVGQIRLWKWATPAGEDALGLRSEAPGPLSPSSATTP